MRGPMSANSLYHLCGARCDSAWRAPAPEVAAAAERDHLLGERLHRLRLRLGRSIRCVDRAEHARFAYSAFRCAESRRASFLCSRALNVVVASRCRRCRRKCGQSCRASVSLTSSIDFLPKFGIAASSFSVFITRSPIVSMPTRLDSYERTPSSSSSIGNFALASAGPRGRCPAARGPRRRWRPGSCRCPVSASWRIRISAASASASFGSTELSGW